LVAGDVEVLVDAVVVVGPECVEVVIDAADAFVPANVVVLMDAPVGFAPVCGEGLVAALIVEVVFVGVLSRVELLLVGEWF
jgi:hypothetical protein